MIAGLENRIGFKALANNGRGLNIMGVLYNLSGRQILEFSSEHAGMGNFRFTPKDGEQYYALVNDMRFDLPEPLPEGTVFSVSENDLEQYVLRLRSSDQDLSDDYLVFGHVRGNVYMATEIDMTNGQGFTAVPKSTFASGVVHFTLLFREGDPISERLVFNDNSLDRLNVDLTLPEESVGKSESVDLGLDLNLPEEDEDITSFASITVYDDKIDSNYLFTIPPSDIQTINVFRRGTELAMYG